MSDQGDIPNPLGCESEVTGGLHMSSEVADLLGSGEPAPKRQRSDSGSGTSNVALMHVLDSVDTSTGGLKQVLLALQRQMMERMDALESKVESISGRLRNVESHVMTLMAEKAVRIDGGEARCFSAHTLARQGQAIVVGLPQLKQRPLTELNEKASPPPASMGTNLTLITLNTEEDYPHGVWLGDENNPETRVRVPITPSDLLHIHSNCRTAEKMALTLLDYLFDRDTQACSNLSGTGKHGKKQLDPLLIYGIRCHLVHRFDINENDWHRIKMNIDSKCRTAFRRKQQAVMSVDVHSRSSDDFGSPSSSSMAGGSNNGNGVGNELQIIQATEDQIVQLQHSHQLQILHGNQLHGDIVQVVGEHGEVLHFHRSQLVPGAAGDDDGATAVTMLSNDDSCSPTRLGNGEAP